MKELIKELKALSKLGVVGIKQSFEDEGALQPDVLTMRRITEQLGLGLSVKIGGCEAKTDIEFCQSIGVDKIVAPMVETPFALTKFIESVINVNDIEFYINIESFTAAENIKKILDSPSSKLLSGVVIGRSDLAKSFGLSKDQVDGDLISNTATRALKSISEYQLDTLMGGNLSPKSNKIVCDLYNKKLLKYIETRNVIIKLNDTNIKTIPNIIKSALLFESNWLQYKAKSYINVGHSYINRSEIIKDRIS
jgi:4-hydroxy-2-oxoheptanedioate aldolase